MRRTKAYDTGSLVIPKTVLLEAVRGTGFREHIIEVYLPDVDRPHKEILSYTCFLAKYGHRLDPGHKQTLEVNSRPLGFPKPCKAEDEWPDSHNGHAEREQGRAFKYSNRVNTGIAHTPHFRETWPGGKGRPEAHPQTPQPGVRPSPNPRKPESVMCDQDADADHAGDQGQSLLPVLQTQGIRSTGPPGESSPDGHERGGAK